MALFVLKVIEEAKTASLYKRMYDAGCVFQFVVLAPESTIEVDEATHRQALTALHDALMKEALQWHQNLTKDPKYEDFPEPLISWDLDDAIATPLSRDEIRNLTLTDRADIFERLALYACFLNPPYRAKFKKGKTEAQSVFKEWCELLGLNESDDVTVVNWVEGFSTGMDTDEDKVSNVEPWSNYFYSGLEWWVVWCLTIWNPKRRTLSAIIASTTD